MKANIKANTALRDDILSESISAEQLVKMSAKEMATDEQRLRFDIIAKQKLDEETLPSGASGPVETDMFKCGRCKSKRTTYFQLQTRR